MAIPRLMAKRGHNVESAPERAIRRVKTSKRMLGDQAYDSAELREELDELEPSGSFPTAVTECNVSAVLIPAFKLMGDRRL